MCHTELAPPAHARARARAHTHTHKTCGDIAGMAEGAPPFGEVPDKLTAAASVQGMKDGAADADDRMAHSVMAALRPFVRHVPLLSKIAPGAVQQYFVIPDGASGAERLKAGVGFVGPSGASLCRPTARSAPTANAERRSEGTA